MRTESARPLKEEQRRIESSQSVGNATSRTQDDGQSHEEPRGPEPTWEAVIHDFLQYCAQDRHYSAATVKAYGSDLQAFARFLSQEYGEVALADIGRGHITQFVESLRGLKASTKRRKLNCLSSFFRYARSQGYAAHNPVDNVPRPRKEKPLPAWLTQPDIAAMHGVVNTVREQAILLTFLLTGVRRQELIDLDVADFDQASKTLRVRNGKGRKDRLLPMPRTLDKAIGVYLAERPKTPCEALFVNRNHRRLHACSLQRMMQRWLREADLAHKDYTLHSLRHTYATQSLRAGVDVRTLQQLMGHEDLSTTAGYLHTDVNGHMAAATKLEGIMLPESNAAPSVPETGGPGQILAGLDERQLRTLADLAVALTGQSN